jgi:hypothetical protein
MVGLVNRMSVALATVRCRYAVLKSWRLHEDGINYVGPPPQHRCMTSEEFDAAVDLCWRRESTDGTGPREAMAASTDES